MITNISFHRGEDITITVSMLPPVSIAGWSISFTMRKQYDVLPILVEKTDLPDIIIINAPVGIFSVKINSAETASAEFGDYYYDIQRVNPGNRSVLVEGVVDLTRMVNSVPV